MGYRHYSWRLGRGRCRSGYSGNVGTRFRDFRQRLARKCWRIRNRRRLFRRARHGRFAYRRQQWSGFGRRRRRRTEFFRHKCKLRNRSFQELPNGYSRSRNWPAPRGRAGIDRPQFSGSADRARESECAWFWRDFRSRRFLRDHLYSANRILEYILTNAPCIPNVSE